MPVKRARKTARKTGRKRVTKRAVRGVAPFEEDDVTDGVTEADEDPEVSEDPDEEDPEMDSPPPDPVTEDEASGGSTLFDNVQGDTYIRVHRMDNDSKRWVYQFRLAPHEATEETIQNLRGGGRYKCKEQVIDPDTGSYVWGRQRTIVVDGPAKPLTDLPLSMVKAREDRNAELIAAGVHRGTALADRAAVQGSDSNVSINQVMTAGIIDLLKAGRENQIAQLEMMKAVAHKDPPPPPRDYAPLITAIVPILTLLFSREKGPNVVEVVEKVAGLLKDTTSTATSFKDQVELFNSMFDLKDRASESTGGNEDPVLALARENLPKLIDLIQKEQNKEPGAIRKAAAAALPPQPAGQATVTDGEPAMPMWQRILQSRGEYLAKMAAGGKDPEVLADYEMEIMPDLARGPLREWLATENAFASAMATIPSLQPYQQWAARFFTRLHMGFFPEQYTEGEGVEEEAVETEIEPDIKPKEEAPE